MRKRTLAIFSPNQNAYSETFIQAHRKLPFNVKFYYGNSLPGALEGNENILRLSFLERVKRRLLKGFSFEEKRLLFSLRKEKVDCVLAEFGITAADSLKVVRNLKLPLIVHFHGYDASEKKTLSRFGEKYKEVFEYADKVIAVSSKMKQSLLDLGCPETKLMVNYYGPDDSFYSVQPSFISNQFISVGRFVDKKAPYLLIIAFKKVLEKFPDAKLVMVGDGELLKVCKVLVRAFNIENNIEFAGVLNAEEINVLFQNSIAFVQHSVIAGNGDSEGTPVAILEAQAAGLPVISTLHAGIPEVVIDGETGLLSREFDVDEMSHNMVLMLEDKSMAQRFGNAGKNRVEENFTLEKHLSLLEKYIRDATYS